MGMGFAAPEGHDDRTGGRPAQHGGIFWEDRSQGCSLLEAHVVVSYEFHMNFI